MNVESQVLRKGTCTELRLRVEYFAFRLGLFFFMVSASYDDLLLVR
jgi:hypothetical protein